MSDPCVDFRVSVSEFRIEPGGKARTTCPVCGWNLTVHQPEPNNPHRLLASCSCEEYDLWCHILLKPAAPRPTSCGSRRWRSGRDGAIRGRRTRPALAH